MCVYSVQWGCNQVGKTPGGQVTHTHLHTWSIYSAAFHVKPTHHRPLRLFLSALDPRLWFISKRGALTFSLCAAHSHTPPKRLVVHSQSGFSPFKKNKKKKQKAVWSEQKQFGLFQTHQYIGFVGENGSRLEMGTFNVSLSIWCFVLSWMSFDHLQNNSRARSWCACTFHTC